MTSESVPPLPLRERQRLEREQLILQTAKEMLLEKGYSDTSMDEIATRVGIAKGTLYLHFARKEDLMYKLFQNAILQMMQTLEQLDSIEGNPLQKLDQVIRAMYQGVFIPNAQLFYVLFNMVDLHHIMTEQKGELLHKVSARIRVILEDAKAEGLCDPTLPTEIMISTFFSMLSPLGYRRLILTEKMLPEEVITWIERIYFRGIGANWPI